MLFARTLQQEEIETWRKIFANESPRALDYAFDNWQRNGAVFPKPKNILDLIELFHDVRRPDTSSCDSICKARHGKGYDTNDALWMWKYIQRKFSTGDTFDYEQMFSELDSQREGGAPKWRRHA